MTREEAIDIIKAERECVYRQGITGECCRDDMGCGACDLVQEDTNIMKAYDMAIEALKEERPHGEWKKDGFFAICSECGHELQHYELVVSRLNFCPTCGADMRKEGGEK